MQRGAWPGDGGLSSRGGAGLVSHHGGPLSIAAPRVGPRFLLQAPPIPLVHPMMLSAVLTTVTARAGGGSTFLNR